MSIKFRIVLYLTFLLLSLSISIKAMPRYYLNDNLLGRATVNCELLNDEIKCETNFLDINLYLLDICQYDYYGQLLSCSSVKVINNVSIFKILKGSKKITIG